MLSSGKIARVYSCVEVRNLICFRGFCQNVASHWTRSESLIWTDGSSSMVESPEFLDWVKYLEDPNNVVKSNDDVVLTKFAKWVDTQRLYDDHSKQMKRIVVDNVDRDVNRLAEMLKGKFESPEAVSCAMVQCGMVELSESLVENMLQRFSNDWILALGFFKWAKEQTDFAHTANCYNMMVNILGRSKNFGLMWELVEEMEKLGLVSVATMRTVMRRLSRATKYDDAIEVFGKFECLGLVKDTSTMNLLMDSLVKENGVEHAYKVFVDFKDTIPPNTHTFNILIHGWCKAGKPVEAAKVLELMEEHGCHADVVSYTSFVEYYCFEKDFQKVDGILDEMQQKGCPPNVVTYTIVIRALGKAKEINASLEIWERMKRSNFVPDADSYGALIFVLSKSGRFKDACDLFRDMSKQNITPNVFTYNTMISAACLHSKEEYALELLQQMEANSCKPDLNTYAPLLKMCCQKKTMTVLRYLLNDMFRKNVSINLNTYTLLVNGLCKYGELEYACSFFEQIVMKGMTPKDHTYKLLMEKLQKKSMQKAKQQIEKLMSMTNLSST